MEWYVILFLILIVLTAGLCMFGVCTVFWMNIYLWDFRIQTEIWEQQSRERGTETKRARRTGRTAGAARFCKYAV